MAKNKNKKSYVAVLFFVIGLFLYLFGLLVLFGSSYGKAKILRGLFPKIQLTSDLLFKFKITGSIVFLLGFLMFMVAIILLYKGDKFQESNVNLIIEGKADVITLIIMTYVMIFMLVVCLIFNELIGALLFGITIVIQSVLNWILIKYFNTSYKKKK